MNNVFPPNNVEAFQRAIDYGGQLISDRPPAKTYENKMELAGLVKVKFIDNTKK